ncbi:MAG: 16S rRNA (guanine(966)-N(2))-methyltransferase RsmD [Herminiimonas sp.]|uniref:16S rRNA (guanine(966)-N(2))-methyltransferase RsmD n=1 Tax=Herminiimonas sp. TaxID=1926289 RepID=UPI00271C7215|nr:16S rRNA (guanine(966)-N(2))-methyltransferase RsmD [Herminiimonas sp.]MDO9421818.1 16S rRNA (guanine(966)-N(2))-methyltransferase RsmD [Herminiimonas sp.]MDO9421827.1 16S rRNA (guanine(966)-N(2))-methyltransferase RsmD [Herminiimonas sp.]
MSKKIRNKPPKPAPKRLPRPVMTHQVRIIGGQWKRTPLVVLDAEGLRPTPDRVRETVFNWINHLIDGNWSKLKCLDLFAGTGVLGFEAASRGAEQVVMVEMHTPAVRQLEATKEKLRADQVSIVRGDAFAAAQGMQARGGNGQFNLIFLDPPYLQNWLAKILPVCAPLLADGGLIYVESEVALDGETPPDWLQGWEVVRADNAGLVFYHLLQAKKLA